MTTRMFRSVCIFVAAWILLTLACTATSTPQIGEGIPPTTEPPHELDSEEPSRSDQWLQATLALRSVEIELVTLYPGEDPHQTVALQIDNSGNVHLTFALPIPPETIPVLEFSGTDTFAFFIIDGTAYTSTAGEAAALADDAYLTMPEDILFGPDGPSLWLTLLAENSFTPAGAQADNGFEATKYTLDGQIDEGSIAGTIWVDNLSNALIGADITISESLFYPPDSGHQGTVQIARAVQSVDLLPVILP
ncbi:MAG: hypothetical protein JXB85_06715 [Anaerolineales bacterium]|nr:hypothetical protein [Anaerolineales bacterium]